MSLKNQPYRSRYSGSELDRAIEYSLKLLNDGPLQLVDTTLVNPAILSEILTPGMYSIAFYVDSYNDEKTGEPILLKVFSINDDVIGQRYETVGKEVERFYTISEATWSTWDDVKTWVTPYVLASADEEVVVKSPTIIFRERKPSSK